MSLKIAIKQLTVLVNITTHFHKSSFRKQKAELQSHSFMFGVQICQLVLSEC